jgi:hypothetical protein
MSHTSCVLCSLMFYDLITPLSRLGDDHARRRISTLRYVPRDWLAVNNGIAQPGSTPECSASIRKNRNTRYTTPTGEEGGANGVRVALGVLFTCTPSRYYLLLCSTIGSGIRACLLPCHQIKRVGVSAQA